MMNFADIRSLGKYHIQSDIPHFPKPDCPACINWFADMLKATLEALDFDLIKEKKNEQ